MDVDEDSDQNSDLYLALLDTLAWMFTGRFCTFYKCHRLVCWSIFSVWFDSLHASLSVSVFQSCGSSWLEQYIIKEGVQTTYVLTLACCMYISKDSYSPWPVVGIVPRLNTHLGLL